jgi:(p)ppGpp synthase/HD superfamily hydrolase
MKLFISLRYFLIGASQFDDDYKLALKVLEYVKHIHTGVRKDGNTPEFQHQLEIAHYLRTLKGGVSRPGLIIAGGLVHDCLEDYSLKFPFLTVEKLNSEFGKEVADMSLVLSKEVNGVKKTNAEYYAALAESETCSIIKGADRINNLGSMVKVFTPEKQVNYIIETEEYVLPMLKSARHRFVEQEAVYENMKLILKQQLKLLKIINNVE